MQEAPTLINDGQEPALDDPKNSSSGASISQDARLDSWKKIASYLKRDVRTMRRWERRRLSQRLFVESAPNVTFDGSPQCCANHPLGSCPTSAIPLAPVIRVANGEKSGTT